MLLIIEYCRISARQDRTAPHARAKLVVARDARYYLQAIMAYRSYGLLPHVLIQRFSLINNSLTITDFAE